MGKLGQPADENLPEVAQYQPHQPVMASSTPLPEVVPDSSPEAAPQRYFMESDKYPAQFDTAPKLPHEPGMSPQDQRPWTGSEAPGSAFSPNSSVPWQPFPNGADDQQTYVGSEPDQEKRICGLRKRLFIIIAVIVGIVIVAAAVGGGVGGALASRDSDDAEPAETASTSNTSSLNEATSTNPTATTATESSTTSSAPEPSLTDLNNQSDPDLFKRFAFQAWADYNHTGNKTTVYEYEGFFDLPFSCVSYIWSPKDDDCCITFCTDSETDAGYACDARNRSSTASGDPFFRISLWCGRASTIMPTKCS